MGCQSLAGILGRSSRPAPSVELGVEEILARHGQEPGVDLAFLARTYPIHFELSPSGRSAIILRRSLIHLGVPNNGAAGRKLGGRARAALGRDAMTERDEAVEIIVCALHRHAAHADVFALVLATSAPGTGCVTPPSPSSRRRAALSSPWRPSCSLRRRRRRNGRVRAR